MQRDVANDLSDSAHDFMRVVWPAVKPCFGGGEIKPCEDVNSEGFAKDLDTLAGIDAWHVSARGMRGVASRIQWGPKNWATFTIRAKRDSGSETELAKRLRAIQEANKGWLMPHLTVQAFIALPRRQGRLLGASVVDTETLIVLADQIYRKERVFDKNLAGVRAAPNAEFVWISWGLLEQETSKIVVVDGFSEAA